MRFTEEQIKDIVQIKENMLQKIGKHQKEIELLEKNLQILDLTLKESSYTKASQLLTRKPSSTIQSNTTQREPNNTSNQADNDTDSKKKSIPITDSNDNLIANAHVMPDQIIIRINNSIKISDNVPPFKSFFLGRIITEMKDSDNNDVNNGKIQKESVIDCVINKENDVIKEIIIKNYRLKERIDDLTKTVGWSLSRMIENINKQ